MASDSHKTKTQLIAELEELREAAEQHECSRRKLQADLQVRIKELRCVYGMSELLCVHSLSLGATLSQLVDLLPTACGPDDARGRVYVQGREYAGPQFHQTSLRQRSDIVLDGEQIGFVEVGYPPSPDGEGRGFLRQELLDAAAKKVAHVIQLHEVEEKARAYHARLRQLASQLTLAEERQRRQFAHDLHDGIGNALAVAKLKLDALADPRTSPERSSLCEVSALLQRTIEDSHSLMFELSPPVLYESGLVAAIEWLGRRYHQQFALEVGVRGEHGRVPLDEDRRVILYRAVKELLTNVVKHSGTCSALVTIEKRADDLSIRVEDTGQGFCCEELAVHSDGSMHFGLFSVRERLAHLGIRCDISSAPGEGTRVSLTAPLTR